MINLQAIQRAAAAIHGRVHRTPILTSRILDERLGVPCLLKAELFQKTGSFKVRGVFNRLDNMSAAEKQRGVIGWSAGNHAAALAYAAGRQGIRCTVVMPETAVRSKIEASRAYGAEIVQHGVGMETYGKMVELRDTHGYTLVHPFDDDDVIAGQGTIGLEIIEDAGDVDTVVVPVGGGGLISGIATAIKSMNPRVRVIGVEPDGAAGVTAALKVGEVVRLERTSTIADGLAAPFTGDNALPHIRAYVDEVVIVSDIEIAQALLFMLERLKLLAEPAGAAALAALLSRKISLKGRTACIVSGGNIDLQKLRDLIPTNN